MYKTASSCVSMPSDQPSLMMWCMVVRSRCSCASSRSNATRTRALRQIERLLAGCPCQASRLDPLAALGQRAEINDL